MRRSAGQNRFSPKSPTSAVGRLPYRTVPYRTVPYRTVPYRTVPYRTVPYRSLDNHCATDAESVTISSHSFWGSSRVVTRTDPRGRVTKFAIVRGSSRAGSGRGVEGKPHGSDHVGSGGFQIYRIRVGSGRVTLTRLDP